MNTSVREVRPVPGAVETMIRHSVMLGKRIEIFPSHSWSILNRTHRTVYLPFQSIGEMFMDTPTPSSESTQVDEFRNAHTVWKKANDSFHDRFQEIITAGQGHDLDTLAQDLASKFDHFIQCSKAFVAGE